MADRETGKPILVTLDLDAGQSSVSATLTNPLGVASGSGSLTEIRSGRYRGTLTPTGDVCDGLWTVSVGSEETQFTVGARGTTTLWEARVGIAEGVVDVLDGTVMSSSGTEIGDSTLYGGNGEYRGKWLVPYHTSYEAGEYRHVEEYNGSSLSLVTPFTSDLTVGTAYVLMHIHPEEVNRSIRHVFDIIPYTGRCPLVAKALTPDEDGIIDIPLGWDYLHAVWATESVENTPYSAIRLEDWSLLPGRQLQATDLDDSYTVNLYGSRDARYPVWEDSWLDLPLETVISQARVRLHQNRSRGQITDSDEHMRRSLMAYQQAADITRKRANKIIPNSRLVLS